ncbi:hypothetical protein U5922_008480 [Aquicoccus sp. G2-2]|uniref:hypothetical protein n=1 Tax=Aquicoccus sp. G2-2 TaxID=3092120 RepID=UPI002AE05842|nr:hypothetical protein [Aquicoccus sp. G2-2]MEA1113508.1 hypothetical protein [Aquicoccus sp. G2-2]
MTAAAQRNLAIAGVAAGVLVFLGANAHFIHAAFSSMPDCAAVEGAARAAKPAC